MKNDGVLYCFNLIGLHFLPQSLNSTSNSSYLSNIAVFHFQDYRRKSIEQRNCFAFLPEKISTPKHTPPLNEQLEPENAALKWENIDQQRINNTSTWNPSKGLASSN